MRAKVELIPVVRQSEQLGVRRCPRVSSNSHSRDTPRLNMKETTALSRRLFFLAGALLLTAPRNTLPAQGPGLFDVFAARKESPSDPLFGGLALTDYGRIVRLRLGRDLTVNNR